MKFVFFIGLISLLSGLPAVAQQTKQYKRWNPERDSSDVIEGRLGPAEKNNFYGRLPSQAKSLVREDVWNLSKNTAGLQLRFRTDADEVIIRYTVAGGLQFPHMPATGVSGIDLYSKTIDGGWVWAAGKYSFADTIVYKFSHLSTQDQHVNNREYTLYFPLYNTVTWMEISTPAESFFKPLPQHVDPPIVVYGTSIAQGACATRPGLAWTNILGRRLGRPVINAGFSGNGQMEQPVIELMAETNAKLYVIDCLPNMVADAFPATEIATRMVAAVKMLQRKRPGIPILFCDHDGYTDDGINEVNKKNYQNTNTAMKAVFDSLITAGTKNIYHLSKAAINQDIETMVDGVHPNDIGMMRYADAYEKIIRTILHEDAGIITTTIPLTQRRDFNVYDWEPRHNAILEYNKKRQPELVFIGNSITHFWGGQPQGPRDAGIDAWNKYFEKKRAVVNMGFGWDRIENVLWRIYHGELDSIAPKQIVLMIGTNNIELNSNEEIVKGLQFLAKAIQEKQPAANILLVGIFPRRALEVRVAELNKMIAAGIKGDRITYADAGYLLLKKDKKIDEALFSDGLHPNAAGYEKLGAFIDQQLLKMK